MPCESETRKELASTGATGNRRVRDVMRIAKGVRTGLGQASHDVRRRLRRQQTPLTLRYWLTKSSPAATVCCRQQSTEPATAGIWSAGITDTACTAASATVHLSSSKPCMQRTRPHRIAGCPPPGSVVTDDPPPGGGQPATQFSMEADLPVDTQLLICPLKRVNPTDGSAARTRTRLFSTRRMIGRRKTPDGLPFRLYARYGKHRFSFA